jgi:hypothetical protein
VVPLRDPEIAQYVIRFERHDAPHRSDVDRHTCLPAPTALRDAVSIVQLSLREKVHIRRLNVRPSPTRERGMHYSVGDDPVVDYEDRPARPIVPIIVSGQREYPVADHILRRASVVTPIVEYRNAAHLVSILDQRVLAPAEARYLELNPAARA